MHGPDVGRYEMGNAVGSTHNPDLQGKVNQEEYPLTTHANSR